MTDNDAYLDSVASRISAAVLAFCLLRVGHEFHADDLRQYVRRATGMSAPGSADRILRALRQEHALGYSVVNRRGSLYRVDWVGSEFA